MNTDNFLIEKSEIEFAQDICNLITDTDTRNRAVANAFGAKIAEKFFDKNTYKVDIISGLHNIGLILDEFDISDIYINNSYIDVRLFFNEEELCIPKSHFDNNVLPVAYMFIRITRDLSNATVTGFVASENIDKSQEAEGFYPVDESQLVSFYDIEPLLVSKEDSYAVGEADIFAFLDNKIEDKNAFIRELIESENGRLKFAKAVKAQYAFNFVSFSQDKNINIATEDVALDSLNDTLTEYAQDDILNFEANSQDDLLLDEQDNFNISLDDNSDNTDNLLDETPIEDFANIDDNVDEINNSNESDILGVVDNNAELAFVTDEEDNLNTVTLEARNEEEDHSTSEFSFSTETTPSFNSLGDDLDTLLNEDSQITTVNDETKDIEQSRISELISSDKENASHEEIVVDDDSNLEQELAKDMQIDNSTVADTDNTLRIEDNDSGNSANNNSEQISTLFNSNDEQTLPDEEIEFVPPKKSKSSVKLLAVIGILVVLGAVGYFGYNQFANQQPTEDDSNLVADSVETQQPVQAPAQDDAMPVESVESVTPKMDTNEGTSEAIPAIEQNLDASILVSNLKVDWEVPAGYASSTSAKRYLVKLGKVIQLNLKTELLLLNKPPISNKIAVEIKYNNGTKKFEAVGITQSSGEKTVDDLILQTVNKALAMNLSTNFDSFGKLQGNPVLIIHL